MTLAREGKIEKISSDSIHQTLSSFINIIRIFEYLRVPVWQMNLLPIRLKWGHLQRNRSFTLLKKRPRHVAGSRDFNWRYYLRLWVVMKWIIPFMNSNEDLFQRNMKTVSFGVVGWEFGAVFLSWQKSRLVLFFAGKIKTFE